MMQTELERDRSHNHRQYNVYKLIYGASQNPITESNKIVFDFWYETNVIRTLVYFSPPIRIERNYCFSSEY